MLYWINVWIIRVIHRWRHRVCWNIPTCEVWYGMLSIPYFLTHYTVLIRFWRPKMHKIQNFLRGGSLQRSHRPNSWWGGVHCPVPRTSSPTLGPSGTVYRTRTIYCAFRPRVSAFGPRTQHTHILFHGTVNHQVFLINPSNVEQLSKMLSLAYSAVNFQ